MQDNKQELKEKDESSQHRERGFFEEVIGESFDLDRGLLATIIYMFKAPGEVIDSYFYNRGRFTNPFRYTFVILAFTTLFATLFIDYEVFMSDAFETGAGRSSEEIAAQMKSAVPDFDWVLYFDNVAVVSAALITKFASLAYIILLVPCFSLFSMLFFKRVKSRFIEHYVMNLYYMTQFALFSIITLPAMIYLPNLGQAFTVVTVLQLGYALWVYKSYLGFSSGKDYVKAITTILLGFSLYSIMNGVVIYGVAFIMTLYF